MNKPFALFFFLLLSALTHAQNFDHSEWDVFLKKHVDVSGKVNYKAIREDDKELKSYLNQFIKVPPENSWNKNEKLAYWINAYNAFTIKLIVDNYPLSSIKDIDSPWDKKFIPINGRLISLNYIEHEILRKMNEPRIHFAINCASFSCPRLLNEAYIPSKIEDQLNKVTSGFINNPSKNIVSEESVTLSKIFNWFKKDFETNGGVINFINEYSLIKISKNVKVTYFKYDWKLNEK
ncbi:DUF547 domain-containing protein [Abyssalbus ytuae]|uniref:DUF547 domain-containing protein n=1 Tax=Abyssalbus ytuae TaxID=2926907 RepID=A0A9E7D309_9FLAO|nr:DUF547 domain-containing protein [Abyssalbus ytuae]UOB18758.1 DUF547 domain-containing protein [Abyssalbus ytuae]